MSYNALAEQWATQPDLATKLFCDLADETPTDDVFTVADVVGKLPCLAQYAERTQGDILRALFRRMRAENWPGDGLSRVPGGGYRWRLRDWRAV